MYSKFLVFDYKYLYENLKLCKNIFNIVNVSIKFKLIN